MNTDLILSTRNIDDVIDAIASAVVRKIDCKYKEEPNPHSVVNPITVIEAAALLQLKPISVYRLINWLRTWPFPKRDFHRYSKENGKLPLILLLD